MRLRTRTFIAAQGIALSLVMVGCQTNECQQCSGEFGYCRDIPRGAIPQPLGSSICQWQNAQTELADRDKFVLYLNEWDEGTSTLTLYGTQHLARIATQYPTTSHPIVIQPDRNPALNDARRQAIVESLAAAGISNAHERIQIANPIAEGLHGLEAPRILTGMQRNNSTAGMQSFR